MLLLLHTTPQIGVIFDKLFFRKQKSLLNHSLHLDFPTSRGSVHNHLFHPPFGRSTRSHSSRALQAKSHRFRNLRQTSHFFPACTNALQPSANAASRISKLAGLRFFSSIHIASASIRKDHSTHRHYLSGTCAPGFFEHRTRTDTGASFMHDQLSQTETAALRCRLYNKFIETCELSRSLSHSSSAAALVLFARCALSVCVGVWRTTGHIGTNCAVEKLTPRCGRRGLR